MFPHPPGTDRRRDTVTGDRYITGFVAGTHDDPSAAAARQLTSGGGLPQAPDIRIKEIKAACMDLRRSKGNWKTVECRSGVDRRGALPFSGALFGCFRRWAANKKHPPNPTKNNGRRPVVIPRAGPRNDRFRMLWNWKLGERAVIGTCRD